MTTYVALTSHGQAPFVVALGEENETREHLEERADRLICGDEWDQPKSIETDTELKNLFIVPMSVARRTYRYELETYYDNED